MKNFLAKNKQVILCTIAFVCLCIIDQRKGSAGGEAQLISTNCVGLCVALLVFSKYRCKDFLKIEYIVWTVLFGFVFTGVTMNVIETLQYRFQWYTAGANIYVWGLLTIRTVRSIAERKQFFAASRGVTVLMGITLFWMGLSLNDSLWPWWYLWMFCIVCLTDFSVEERSAVWKGMQTGLIISFFLIQGCAFVFRPYDVSRYLGMYANTNMNALFYSVVYCVLLGTFCRLLFFDDGKWKKVRVAFNIALCGAMWSFVCLTMCRTALISMAAATMVAGVYCLKQFENRFILKGLATLAGLALCIVVSFPIVYGAVRYLPTVFHHPIWFVGEYHVDKVHSYDPYNSEKYISLEEFFAEFLGRIEMLNASGEADRQTFLYEDMEPIQLAFAGNNYIPYVVMQPVALVSDPNNSVEIRSYIYKEYLGALNLLGHQEGENGVWVTEDYWAPHAHNLFLQLAFNFGWPAGVLFVALMLYAFGNMFKRTFETKQEQSYYALVPLLSLINILVFSMFEITWVNGQLTFVLLFLLPALLQSGKTENVS